MAFVLHKKGPAIWQSLILYFFPSNRSTNVASDLTITPVAPVGPKHEGFSVVAVPAISK